MAAPISKVRELLSQQFIAALGQGMLPWTACWRQERPLNAITGKSYRGVNAVVLSFLSQQRGYSDPRWCTFHQAKERGWQVMKGAKGAPVEYWAYYDTKEKKLLSWSDVRMLLKLDPDYEKHLQLRCRTYTVFNGEQIQGIPPLERGSTDIGALRQHRDTLIENMGIRYQEQGNEAYYSPSSDTVTLPPEAAFDDTYSYMATFLHECGHATGHPSRLDRDLSGGFGTASYAREELRAEVASAFTAQSIGLQLTPEQMALQTQRHAAYIQHWASILKDSPDELFRAIKAAEEISDYLLRAGEFQQEQDVTSGQIGEATYTVKPLPDGQGMLLSIEGVGRIPDQVNLAARPWQAHAAAIRQVFIGDGVTALGDGVLQDLPALEKITCPGSLRSIGHQRLSDCKSLREVEYPQANQSWIRRSRPHSPAELFSLADQYPGLTVEQLEEVSLGIQHGHTPEQIQIYARAEFSPLQMDALRYCISTGLSEAQLQMIANPAFSSVQMDAIRCGFDHGFTPEQVRSYAKPELSARQMMDRFWEIRNGSEWQAPLPQEPREPPLMQTPPTPVGDGCVPEP